MISDRRKDREKERLLIRKETGCISRIIQTVKSLFAEQMKNDDYIGKYVLAGITEVDRQDNVITSFEKHGRISLISSEGIVIVNPDTGEEFTLPPAVEHLQKAKPGRYRLKSCDDVVDDPDFVSVWTVTPGETEEDSEHAGGHVHR